MDMFAGLRKLLSQADMTWTVLGVLATSLFSAFVVGGALSLSMAMLSRFLPRGLSEDGMRGSCGLGLFHFESRGLHHFDPFRPFLGQQSLEVL
jgi:hypothetical protein